ncbi:MAG: hypothetical protein P4L53_25785 [Candidatus Obscuribacterales bacterium]|nr:hypothetical protein [Candidatus Obscuribacterales bacterium]
MKKESEPQVPSIADWSIHTLDLDGQYAFERFWRKTIVETQEYFKTAALGASECLEHMPIIPFQFYIFAYVMFLPIVEKLLPVCEFVANNQAYFDAEDEIFGSYKSIFDEIEAVLAAKSKNTQKTEDQA